MNETSSAPMSWRDRLLFFGVLAVISAALFHQSFKPEMVLFSSDGPLGLAASRQLSFPQGFTGMWFDSNWLGTGAGPSPFISTWFVLWFFGPVAFAKFLAPIQVLMLGMAATFCFRVFGFRPMVCLLAGIAAELNSNFFSNACWGVGTRCTALAATFLALAAIWSSGRSHRWLKLILAGFATGLAVMEGADNGMIFSLFIAAFAFFVPIMGEGPALKRIVRGAATVAVVAAFALFIAYQTVEGLVGTQIKGVAGMEQTAEAKDKRWVGATLWSLPKREMLRVIIPGVFGYRMDTPKGGEYWGGVGSDPQIAGLKEQLKTADPQTQQQIVNSMQYAQWRSSGAGEYAGVLVILVAAWAVARSFSRKAQTYSALEKKVIWFWAAMGFVGMLLAWGRHAPFYQLFYALPYMSTIRNPMKFMHATHMTFMILFAFGLQGLSREYLEKAQATVTAIKWDKLWKYACLAAVSLAAIGWFVYSAQKPAKSGSADTGLVRYMKENAIGNAAPTEEVARFSIREVGWFVLVLGISVAALLALQAGMFRGPRAAWAGVLLALILFADLARANAPWIQYFDYKARYASNPLFDLLRERSWEHRVAKLPLRLNEAFANFENIYRGEWMQHQFQYYNIQMLDIVHEGGRANIEKDTFVNQFDVPKLPRYWRLTNTRYIFGIPGLADALNRDLDPLNKSFRQRMAFSLYRKPGSSAISVETNATGPFALVEFTGTLPRASLYSHWRVLTNDTAALAALTAPEFKPESEVIVAEEIPVPASTASVATNTAEAVEYISYSPQRLVQRTSSSQPGVLIVRDRWNPDWQITIDGQRAKLLRANVVMRGVQVPAGQHQVVWSYKPKLTAFYISATAIGLAVALCGLLIFLTRTPAPATRRK